MREKRGIPSGLKLVDLGRTAWTEMANKGASVPKPALSAGWSMKTAATNLAEAGASEFMLMSVMG